MKKTSIGGQALIEGIMMIGPEGAGIAVRKPDGEIVLDKKELPKKNFFTKMPLVRGSVVLFRQMVIGMKALMYSAEFVDLEEEQQEEKTSKFEKFLEKVLGDKLQDALIYFSVIIALFFSIGLFILLPNLLASFMHFNKGTSAGVIYYNLFEGLIRVSLFFGYIVATSYVKDIQRIWEYHGAEHKTINCYEKGEELTIANVKKYPTFNARCGTSFMILVMIVSILVFSLMGWYGILMNILLRLVLIPVVAGISYELIKYAGRSEGILMKIISAPGYLLQKFTTKEPDELQIEVAIVAFNSVKVADPNADNW